MKNIPCPEYDNYKLWKDILELKRLETRKKLNEVKDSIKERYEEYRVDSNSVVDIFPTKKTLIKENKENLKSFYGNNKHLSKAKEILYDNVYKVNHNKCPYCMINEPNTLDHYYDKSDYPEYSVFVPNLIPCCSKCNRIKGTKVFDSNNNRIFLHFYYDFIPSYKFIYIRYSFDEVDIVPVYNIDFKFQDNEKNSTLIKSHFKALNLKERYRKIISDKTTERILDVLGMKNDSSLEQITKELEKKLKNLIKLYGVNSLDACIIEGFLESPNFLQNIINNGDDYKDLL